MKLVMRIDGLYPVSTNDMYIPTRGKGQYGAFLRKSDTLKDFQINFSRKLQEKYSQEIARFLELSKAKYPKYLGFNVHLWVGMNDMFYKRTPDDLRPYDASNYLKAVEDVISMIFEIDDKYNMHVEVDKFDIEADTWVIIIEYEPIEYMAHNTSYKFPEIDGIEIIESECPFSEVPYCTLSGNTCTYCKFVKDDIDGKRDN